MAIDLHSQITSTEQKVKVKKSLNEQSTLKNRKEHCSADPKKLATIARAKGQQIRIRRNEAEYALYTISEIRQERPDKILRMSQQGRSPLLFIVFVAEDPTLVAG